MSASAAARKEASMNTRDTGFCIYLGLVGFVAILGKEGIVPTVDD